MNGATSAAMTVFFEEPFWVGVVERTDDNGYSVCKITFGAEPHDYEVYALILQEYERLKFSSCIPVAEKRQTVANHKKAQRNAGRQLAKTGTGTRSQQTLQQQREQNKMERRQKKREQKQQLEELQYQLKQQKRREKHKGH